jgi:hypothetical protein
MNSFEFLAIRKLQKECGASDSQVAEFLDLVEIGSSLAPVEWAALAHELEKRADDIRCIAEDRYYEATRCADQEFPIPF